MDEVRAWLDANFDKATPLEFYRDIFPQGELDQREGFSKGKYTGIAIVVTKEKKKIKSKTGKERLIPVCKRYTVTDELDNIEELVNGDEFCVMAPLSYAGKSRTSENARMLYAMVFDLDGIIIKDGFARGLEDFYQGHVLAAERLPMPTYIVASGTGVHLYYVFETAIPLFQNVVKQLQKYKHEMTEMIWNEGITTLGNSKDIQQEGIFQAFRMPGSVTKNGERVVAYKCGKKVSMFYMNSFVWEDFQVKEYSYKSELSKAEAKELYPEWFERRVVRGEGKKAWAVNRNLYDWWKREILSKAKVGHRYYCMMMLSVYAQKCSLFDEKKNPNPVTREELEADCFEIMEYFESLTTDPKNHFDEIDVQDALEAFEARYMTYPRNSVAYKSGIEIKANKRNGMKQKDHLEEARALQDIRMKRAGKDWREGNGRKSKKAMVIEYVKEHPDDSPTAIAKALNMSRTTVYKHLGDMAQNGANMSLQDDYKKSEKQIHAERQKRLLAYYENMLR